MKKLCNKKKVQKNHLNFSADTHGRPYINYFRISSWIKIYSRTQSKLKEICSRTQSKLKGICSPTQCKLKVTFRLGHMSGQII